MVKSRLAIPPDAFTLSSLSLDVQRLHAEHHPGIFKMPASEDFALPYFEAMLADPAVRIFIAEDEGKAVGCIVCKLMERPDNPFTYAARTLLVDQISVRPEARGKGVGRELMNRAEMLGRALNAARIDLNSWDFNLDAHAFFERMGYEKFNFRFWKHL